MTGIPDSADFDFDPGSFRDRNGRVLRKGDRIFRLLTEQALKHWEILAAKQFFVGEMQEGRIVPTERVLNPDSCGITLQNPWSAVLEHQKIPFVSYPYEWSFGMLKDAALLQLDLLREALQEGMILKDSTPFNMQWIGAKPVFIDILSFEQWNPGEPWTGYRQFCQMFLYPLFLQAYKEISFQQWLRGSVDGISVEQCNQILSFRDLFRPGVFTHCYLQSKLQSSYAGKQISVKSELKSAGFSLQMIRHNVNSVRRTVHQLSGKRSKSEWSDYADNTSYTKEEQERKRGFVRRAVLSRRWNLVWDIGCNTGTYSRIAAENASYVLAMDADHLSVEQLYRELKTERSTNILPMVMNVTDPSPNLGWRGRERSGLKERGKPDLILCLALIHHIVINNNIPLKDFVEWLSDQCKALIIEYISKNDPMVKRLLLNKFDNYYDYEQNFFETCLSEFFIVDSRETLASGNRILYFARCKVNS